MTEAEWLACRDPGAMLNVLSSSYRHLSARKLRLFATYCCRSVLGPDHEPALHRAIGVAECYAEGDASEADVRTVHGPVQDAWLESFGSDYVISTVWCLTNHAAGHPFAAATDAAVNAREAAHWRAGTGTRDAEAALQADWLRDLFPNPYRPKFVSRDWFRWHGSTPAILAARCTSRVTSAPCRSSRTRSKRPGATTTTSSPTAATPR